MPDFLNALLNEPVFIKILIGLGGVAIILGITRLILIRVTKSIENPDHRYRIRKLIVFLGYLLAVLFLAGEFSNQLHSVTIALGVASAGIAFALQEIIISAAGWLAISFGRFYKIGDRIQLNDTVGDVIDIGIFSTTLMEIGAWIKGDQYSGRVVRIANSFVFAGPVYNYSGDFPYLWDELVLPVMYGSDIQAARTILQTAANQVVGKHTEPAKTQWANIYNKYRLEHESVDPRVTLTANDNWMEFTLRYVVGYKNRRGTKDQLFESILNQIEQSSGQVRVASTTLQLVDIPAVRVDLAKEGEKS